NWNVLCTVKRVEKEPSGCTGTDPAVASSQVSAGSDAHSMIDTFPWLTVGSYPMPVTVTLWRSVNPLLRVTIIDADVTVPKAMSWTAEPLGLLWPTEMSQPGATVQSTG